MTTAGLLVVLICLALSEASSAQSMTISLGGEKNGGTTARIVQMLALLTVLSIAPSLLVMVTAFTRIVIVLSFLRTAIGAQSAPPNSVLMSLALFLTFFVMAPTFEKSYNDGIRPMMDEEISTVEGFNLAVKPIHAFMMRHVREKDLALFFKLSKTTPPALATDTPLRILVPSFMISELRRSFEIGFLIFIPFLIIDMAVASVLLAMGMMFLPPSLVSMPFKLIFFVLVDGWYLVAGSLIKGFGEN
ncbi:MAG: flagellar type III secretion system pore protein FliP [Alphaproteobacteria bacterium]|nr:flagellar type III secretion system pore protein FliP [Alphaproteobacteria bacterium]